MPHMQFGAQGIRESGVQRRILGQFEHHAQFGGRRIALCVMNAYVRSENREINVHDGRCVRSLKTRACCNWP